MAKVPDGIELGALSIASRRVLLDALSALYDQRRGVIVVGAHAVQLRSAEVRLPVAAYTSDADLGLDPRKLVDEPLLHETMAAAGFTPAHPDTPGTFRRTEQVEGRSVPIAVDLLVPEQLAGRGRRAASIPPHAKMTARRVPGLECVVLDHDLLEVTSLEPERDQRRITAQVAGHAALLVAKAYKIHERSLEPGRDRLADKDAGDILRLMRSDLDPAAVAARFARLLADPTTAEVARTGLGYLHGLFSGRATLGTAMAADSLDDEHVRAIAPAYIRALSAELGL